MRTETFYAGRNRSGNILHVETDGAIVNIRVGLRDNDGHPVTVVEVLPEDETRSPDLDGHYWHTEDADGNDTRGAHVRIVRQDHTIADHVHCLEAGHSDPGEAYQESGYDHDHCGLTGHPDPGETP